MPLDGYNSTQDPRAAQASGIPVVNQPHTTANGAIPPTQGFYLRDPWQRPAEGMQEAHPEPREAAGKVTASIGTTGQSGVSYAGAHS